MESLSTSSSMSSNATISTSNDQEWRYDLGYNFAKITLDADNNCVDDCGSNGLPVTPNSISIIGNFKSLVYSVNHPYIVQYVDCYRSKNGESSGPIKIYYCH